MFMSARNAPRYVIRAFNLQKRFVLLSFFIKNKDIVLKGCKYIRERKA